MPQDPLIEQRTTTRKNQILDAATVVFSEKGFHRTTIKAIAREAGVADGTIYNYFGNKEDLLMGLLDRLNETEQRQADLMMGLEGDRFEDFFAAYLHHRLTLMEPNLPLLRAILPEVLVNPRLRTRYQEEFLLPTTRVGEQFFEMLIAQGVLKPLSAPLMVRTMAASIFGLVMLRLLGDSTLEKEWQTLSGLVPTLLLNGFALTE